MVKGRKRPSKKQGGKANDPKLSQEQGHDLGQMANLKLVDKRGKELVELKLQVLV